MFFWCWKLSTKFSLLYSKSIILWRFSELKLTFFLLKLTFFSFSLWWDSRQSTKKYSTLAYCKTQNSGLRSKEENPHDPINQPSRCNTQEGLLTVAQTGWLWSPGRQSTQKRKLGKLFIDKKPYDRHITYGLQSDWLHVCKAILLVQTSRAFVQT